VSAAQRQRVVRGQTPSDEIISAAYSRVKSWMVGQSVLWMEKATQLYQENISDSSPRLFIKQIPKNPKKYRTLPPFKTQRKIVMQKVQFKERRKEENSRHKARRSAKQSCRKPITALKLKLY
jgi:hypothetical protein